MIDEIYFFFWDFSILVSEFIDLSYKYLHSRDIILRKMDHEVYDFLRYRKTFKMRRRKYKDAIGFDILFPIRIDRVVCIDTKRFTWINIEDIFFWK